MGRNRLSLLALAAGTILGCSSPTSTTSELLSLSSNGSTLTLENPNNWTVFYMALNANQLALFDGAMCDDPSSTCPRVPPRSSISIPYDHIWAYSPGTHITVQVVQWRLEPQLNGRYRTTQVQSQQTELQ